MFYHLHYKTLHFPLNTSFFAYHSLCFQNTTIINVLQNIITESLGLVVYDQYRIVEVMFLIK